MKRLDYMLLCLSAQGRHILKEKNWAVRCFAKIPTISEKDIDPDKELFLQPTQQDVIFYFKGERHLIDDIKDPQAGRFFRFDEPITVTPKLFENVYTATETTIGKAFFNAATIVPSFGSRLNYINDDLKVSAIEAQIHELLIDDPEEEEEGSRSPTHIHVYEYLEFIDRLMFLTNLSDIINFTGTEKVVLPPDDVAKKKAIIDQYKDQLSDPVVLRHVESELQKLDEDFLKDDPANNRFLSGKAKNVARKKMVLIYGDERGFEKKARSNPITTSLLDGLSTAPDQFTNYINASRSGSYSRGSETVNGGVVSKMLLRSMGSLSVVEQDCGTQRGLKVFLTEDKATSLVSRTMRVGQEWTLIESLDQAKALVGKTIEVRSPLYCQSPGLTYCGHCLNDTLRKNPHGIAITISEVSSTILGMFMAAMHGKELKTTEVSVEELIN